jgi:hypothetical protein
MAQAPEGFLSPERRIYAAISSFALQQAILLRLSWIKTN